MKIFFVGSVFFSKVLLEKLIKLEQNIIGINTLNSSMYNSDYFDLKIIGDRYNIPVRYATDINKEDNIKWIKSLKPDVIFCFGWSRLLKKEFLNISKVGVVGYHPTLLPTNRGRHPIIWAIALGLKRTGSTFFIMDEGADSGDIISQKEIKIHDDYNSSDLYNVLIKTSLLQIEEFLPKLKNNSITKIKQNHSKANYWRKRTVNDGVIDWRMSSIFIHRLVKSLVSPYDGACFYKDEKRIIVSKSKIIRNYEMNIEPGKILSKDNDGYIIKTGDDAIKIFINSKEFKLKLGDYLENTHYSATC